MSYETELAFAKDLAYEAGAIMSKHFQVGVASVRKEDNTHLTAADTAINELVIKRINSEFVGHSILGEEASSLKEDAEFTWVCDPIDGTMPYSFGLATNVFAITLVRQGVPQTGVVYDPHLHRLFWATKDNGAYMGDKRLEVNKEVLSNGVVGLSGKKSKVIDTPFMHMEVERKSHRIVSLGSAIYEGMLVSSGQLAGHIYPGSNAHDTASSKLFIEEAGGKVTDLFGNDQPYDQEVKGMVASNDVVHDELLALVQKSLLKA